ncbi:stage V sporulation protein AA [Falsibacillus pallidus]|uniref:stage V sporulation protein AA n=1 Tax=Falsibacillus pallidus TaxID=493781 RepID=UPI003D954FE5
MESSIYLKLRHRIQVHPESPVILQRMAQVIAPEALMEEINSMVVYQVTEEDQNIIIIDVMKVLHLLRIRFPECDIQTIGPSQTIVEVIYKKKRMSIPMFILVWLLLFIGAGLAIMNFHEDVSMREVHQNLYKIITGRENEKPLIFQIPYSLGLGVGMILFFNHVFRKRINEEPSPLEVEMFNYQSDLDQYVIMNENKESMKHIDDD